MRMDDMQREFLKKLSTSSQNLGNKDIQQLQALIEARISEFEEKMNEKANKQSVA